MIFKQLKEHMEKCFRAKMLPKDFLCPKCGGRLNHTDVVLCIGPYSGSVACVECKYKASVCDFLMDAVISVEPMLRKETDDASSGKTVD